MRSFAAFVVLFTSFACAPGKTPWAKPPSRIATLSHREDADPERQNNATSSLPPMPLHTRGRYIVDATGSRFKLASVNWYGASDTNLVPGGLDRAPLPTIVTAIKALGFNSVRLQFSNLMLHLDAFPAAAVAANPSLVGLTPLAVYDQVVAELTRQGVAVILNNHTTHPMWCCNYDDDGLWYTYDYSEQQWLDDWAMMAARYRNNTGVIAADLRNEVRIAKLDQTLVPNPPNWAKGPNDWRATAERGGAQVLGANPNLLVVVEGINFPRYNLRGVYLDPIRLPVPDHLVYAAHNYGYLSPDVGGATYGSMDYPTLQAQLGDEWGFVTTPNQAYTAPAWVSEFGENSQASDRTWLQHLAQYLANGDFDFAYWALNAGPKASGDLETYSLLSDDWTQPLSDWRTDLLNPLMTAHQGPGVEPHYDDDPGHHFTPAIFSDWDTNLAQDRGDWLPGTFKGRCRESERLVGMSVGQRAGQSFAHEVLCSDYGLALTVGPLTTLANNNRDAGSVNAHTSGQDWAPGAVKLECAVGSYVVGAAQTRNGLSYTFAGVLCSAASQTLGNTCRALNFASGDNRTTAIPGDWDPNQTKGQCGLSAYVAGVSVQSGHIQSLLCCQ